MADNKELGRIHIYCGNGKGKTTCGMGLCVRAASGSQIFFDIYTEEEKAQRRIFYAEQFRKATQTAVQNGYDVLFLDEIVYTIRAGLFDEAMLIDFLKNKPEHLEVILTGRDPSPGLIELADYVSEIRKVKHPFDRGLPARRGIEC